ncbi:MAG TPA: peptidylprolyl isomerase [Burkholderiales bacterium]|jgi:peptidyl-prolyl cis-trans isomerase C|nr:peptidylprolyl isomerase [Burkholderiales bacterium]
MPSGKRLKTLAAGIALAALIAPAAAAQGVKVNGKEIPQSRIDVGVKSRIAQGQPDTPELRNTVKDALINQEIIAQEAVKKGLNKKPDVAAAIEINRQDILVNAYVQDYLQKNPVNDETLKKEYERIKTQVGGKEYKARHILVENEADAKDIIAQIKKGASFEKLAAERSKDTGTKDKGGDLDWNVPGNFVKPFGEALAKLKKGQMTEAPVQSNFGWHVIRLEDERAFQPPAFDSVKANLQRSVQQQMIQKAVAELRAKAKVE